jgi:hypothetical protein
VLISGTAVAGGIGTGVYQNWHIAKRQTRIREVIDLRSDRAAFYLERLHLERLHHFEQTCYLTLALPTALTAA